MDEGMGLVPFPEFPHFPSNRISCGHAPIWAQILRVDPYLSRFIPIFPLRQHLARFQPFPGTASPRNSTPGAFPGAAGGSRPHSSRRSAAFASGSDMNKGARDFWERCLARLQERWDPWIWGAPEQLPPSGDFPPSPPLPDLGNDSGDRNPGLGSSELRDEWDYSSLDKIPWKGAGRGGGNEWACPAGCELQIPPGPVNDPN